MFKGQMYLTLQQYQTLINGGSITVDGKIYYYDEDVNYVTDSNEVPMLKVTQEQYKTLLEGGTITIDGIEYTYDKNTSYVTDDDTQTQIDAIQTQLDKLQELLNSIKSNATQINDSTNNNVRIGGVTESDGTYNITIGPSAKSLGIGNIMVGPSAMNTLTTTKAVVVGGYATTVSNNTITLGSNARTEAEYAIQLGEGTNKKEKSFQVFTDNIYDAINHILTVKNAQIDGSNIYGLLSGEGKPTSATIGKEGQQYLDTTTGDLYHCTLASTDNYAWELFNGKVDQAYVMTTDGVRTIRIGNLLMQSKSFSVTGNSEQVFTFPTAFTHLLYATCNGTADGQSAINGSSVIEFNETSMTVRVCGSNSVVTAFAIGWKED